MKQTLLNLLHILLPILLVVYGMVELRILQYAEANAAFYVLDFFRLAAGVVFGLLLWGCSNRKVRPWWPAISLALLVGVTLYYFIIPAVFRLFPMLLLGVSVVIESGTLGKMTVKKKNSK